MGKSTRLRQNNPRTTMRQLRQTPRRQRLDNRPYNPKRPTKPRHQQPTIHVPRMQRAQTRPHHATHPMAKQKVGITNMGGVRIQQLPNQPTQTTHTERQQTMPKHKATKANWKAELYYLRRLWHSHGKYKLKQLIKQITKH